MSQYKMQQVLRTTRTLPTVDGTEVPSGTRVVVMNQPDEKTVRVKVMDKNLPDLQKARLVAGVSRFKKTFRGRPRKDAK